MEENICKILGTNIKRIRNTRNRTKRYNLNHKKRYLFFSAFFTQKIFHDSI